MIDIKGSFQLAQAIPLILQKKNEVKFLIVGDGALLAIMKSYLKEAGCLDRVEFVGWVPHEITPDYFNKMKFHVLPSFFDYPGTVNLEAMACGTIAISNNAGSPAVVVYDDAAAAVSRQWSEWRIALQAFADQGINLTNVDKIAIGLGSIGGAAAGGTGTMYIDDITLERP